MFFAIPTKLAPLYALLTIILGGAALRLGISEGHEIIGAGLAMLTLSRRDDDPRPPAPPAVVVPLPRATVES